MKTAVRETALPYRDYPPLGPSLMGYDPVLELPADHLARLVDQIVDQTVVVAMRKPKRGCVPYNPCVCLKVLVYGYSLGIRSSRQLEEMCRDRLSFKLLTRGQVPNYHTLCNARNEQKDFLEQIWLGLFSVAEACGIKRCGRIVVDSTKLGANASPEATLHQGEFAPMLAELERILGEAAAVDAAEAECAPADTLLGKTVDTEQMRDILRRVRAQAKRSRRAEGEGDAPVPPKAAPKRLTARMRSRVKQAKSAIEAAQAEGRKHLCVTDPDARMMFGTRDRKVKESHSFEVAADNGLLVAGNSSQAANDNSQLEGLVDASRRQEPEGVKAVTADSGYYSGDAIARLAESGIDLCVPDGNTAADMRKGRPIGTTISKGKVAISFKYDAEHNCYRCPQGNVLRYKQKQQHGGQLVSLFRASRDCTGCPLASVCLRMRNTKRRVLKVGRNQLLLDSLRQRFSELEHRKRYHLRGHAIETVFAYLKQMLGYTRWLLRGAQGVAAEASLFKIAYQMRKVHTGWAAAH